MSCPKEWQNPLVKKAVLEHPLVEVTPVIWRGRLVLAECWQKHWRGAPPQAPCVRIRDVESDEILVQTFHGHGLASAFVWGETFYLLGAQLRGGDEGATWNHVWVSCSEDLASWTPPRLAVQQEEGEHLYNQSVCHDGRRFVMAYESNTHVPFTIKFAESDDLMRWRKLPGAVFGAERYAACPAIRFAGGYYYLLYLERPGPQWWFETWLARSPDLRAWELAPRNPVIAPDPELDVHPDCPEAVKEQNASDPDLVEWQGKTRVYFTGGNQHWGGRLQYAEYDGPMQAFFESYYDPL